MRNKYGRYFKYSPKAKDHEVESTIDPKALLDLIMIIVGLLFTILDDKSVRWGHGQDARASDEWT